MKAFGLLLSLGMFAFSASAHENGTIKIYDGQLTIIPVRPMILKDGKRRNIIVPKKARELHKNLELIRDYFYNRFERRSWDGNGADIVAYINSGRYDFINLFGIKENAFWSKEQKCFHFGDGGKRGMDDFERALDVVAHEYTHAVIETSSQLAYEGQSGALNEHLADVFGSIIHQHYKSPERPYLIGQSVLRGKYRLRSESLRDMKNPALGAKAQPGHMSDLNLPAFSQFKNCFPNSYNDRCGVHVLSGIPNRMSVVVMESIPLEDSATLFYNVMTKRLKKKSQFKDYARALLLECQEISQEACVAVEAGLRTVGL